VKRLILLIAAAALGFAGCAAAHYHDHGKGPGRVTLYLKAPGAKKVEFVSSLHAFNPQQANRLEDSRWEVTVAANSEFKYFYIVDGAVFLPECEFYEKDDFGSRNCVYVPGE
jgi:hypothetical protein